MATSIHWAKKGNRLEAGVSWDCCLRPLPPPSSLGSPACGSGTRPPSPPSRCLLQWPAQRGAGEHHHPRPLLWAVASPSPARARVALTEDAGQLGHAGHKALEVHTQAAVPVAAGERLGQLVVEVEA